MAAPHYNPGDLVTYDGLRYEVDSVFPGTAYQAPRLALARDRHFENGNRVTIVDVSPDSVTLVCRVGERTLF